MHRWAQLGGSHSAKSKIVNYTLSQQINWMKTKFHFRLAATGLKSVGQWLNVKYHRLSMQNSYPFVYIKWSISPVHHESKQRRQKAWDDGVAPGARADYWLIDIATVTVFMFSECASMHYDGIGIAFHIRPFKIDCLCCARVFSDLYARGRKTQHRFQRDYSSVEYNASASAGTKQTINFKWPKLYFHQNFRLVWPNCCCPPGHI